MILLFKIGFLEVSWVDIVDISLVSILLYQVYKLIRGSIALKIFLGILSLYLIYLIVRAAQMELLGMILGQFMGVGVLAAIILFQPEIRKFLLLIGRTTEFNRENFLKSILNVRSGLKEDFDISPVIEAAKSLAATNTGALIVFSRDTELKFYAESGDLLEAEISKRLLLSIFSKVSPLHDDAVIIYKGKIKAARCILPVTENDKLPAHYGLRHRAALGMSETTDTLVMVVSEETGSFSIAKNGKLYYNISAQELRERILEYLHDERKEYWLEEDERKVLQKTEEVKASN
ncbi:MAG TPA: diadenylate cyclase CdaA [Cyclobacteriaceae bacterium]|nr:diadenylate cyclase CdaA [Cyclobacteriaceae bacterium]